ncbi:hypothetical protein GN109_24550 [Collimonas pratensis]|nr:hypothetical protein [Collimonas pratensis]NKI72593.1 hypothetical protein [Collimonas pratensis]
MFLHEGYHQINDAMNGIGAEEHRFSCEHMFVRMRHVRRTEATRAHLK